MKLNKLFATLCVMVVALIALGNQGTSMHNAIAATAEPTASNPLLDDDRKWVVVHEVVTKETVSYGFVGSIAFNDSDLGVLAGTHSTLYFTSDGGKTWTQGKASYNEVLAFDIVTPSLMWLTDLTNGVRYSTDGGKTWVSTKDSAPETIAPYMIRFIDDQSGWIATSKEVLTTSDASKTWASLPLPDGVVNLLQAIDLRTANDGYLFTLLGNLFTTTDSGKSWTSQPVTLGTDKHVDFNVTPVLRFVDADHGIVVLKIKDGDFMSYKTNDGGKTWTESPVPVKGDRAAMYLSHDGGILTVTVFGRSRQDPPENIYVLSYQKP